MGHWDNFSLPDYIIKALENAKFDRPTPIQEKVLSYAINDQSDILGAAPTQICNDGNLSDVEMFDSFNSLQYIDSSTKFMNKKNNKKKNQINENNAVYNDPEFIEELDIETGEVCAIHTLSNHLHNDGLEIKLNNERVYGIVLLPTRELALQVCKHLKMLTEFCNPPIRVEAIVGGISIQKQIRLLQRHPEILVATPGRLWQLIELGEPHTLTVKQANILVVDEADKLVEVNHYKELEALFNWLRLDSDSFDTKNPPLSQDKVGKKVKKQSKIKSHKLTRQAAPIVPTRQTLVFSATLTFVHKGAIKPGTGSKKRKLHSEEKKIMTTRIKLCMLRNLLGLKKTAKIIDLSSVLISGESNPDSVLESNQVVAATPHGLREFRLMSPNQAAKDVRLFWFISYGRFQNNGMVKNQRCLIFLNSKAGVRRLAGVMRQIAEANAFQVFGQDKPLNVNVLHSDMIQKQRLRALERFQVDSSGILIASDVASRGLDLAGTDGGELGGISWVVHFEVPHTAELYIHRRGRTARANRTGNSLLLISPNEMIQWRRFVLNLNRSDTDLPDLDQQPTHSQLDCCDQIVNLAKQLDLANHQTLRSLANQKWLQKAAKEADILLDDDDELSDQDSDSGIPLKMKKHDETNNMRYRLKEVIQSSRRKLLNESVQYSMHGQDKLHKLSKVKLLRKLGTV